MEEDKVLGWRREPIQKQAVKISGRKVWNNSTVCYLKSPNMLNSELIYKINWEVIHIHEDFSS